MELGPCDGAYACRCGRGYALIVVAGAEELTAKRMCAECWMELERKRTRERGRRRTALDSGVPGATIRRS